MYALLVVILACSQCISSMLVSPTCNLSYNNLKELFYSADPHMIEATLRQCLPEILNRRPERQSQRVCALAKLAMKLGNRNAVCAILDQGRCAMMNPASMDNLREKAIKYGMEGPMIQMCGNGMRRRGFAPQGYDHYYKANRLLEAGQRIGHSIGHGLRQLGLSATNFTRMGFRPNELLPIDIFRNMSRTEASSFGFNGECTALTFDHFAFPGARVSVIKTLPVECFQSLSPDCFAGMSRKMVRSIKHWPAVRPEQVAALSPSAIRGLNWDFFGWEPMDQFSGHRQSHPCSGVTFDQEMAMKPMWNKWQKYEARCLGGPPLHAGYFGYKFTGGLFYFFIVLFAILLLLTAFV